MLVLDVQTQEPKILTKVQLDRMTRFDGQVIEHFTYPQHGCCS